MMMLSNRLSAVALVVAIFSCGAQAQTGNELLRWCQAALKTTTENVTDASLCSGYLQGFFVGIDTGIAFVSKGDYDAYQKNKIYCQPVGVTLNQIARIVVKDLESRPADLHQRGGTLIAGALHRAFPCPP